MTLETALRVINENPLYVSDDDDLNDPVSVARMVIDRIEDDKP